MLKLVRNYRKDWTDGKLFIENIGFIYTLELPYKNNRVNVSCIIEGNYYLQTYTSKRLGECLKVWRETEIEGELKEPFGRSDILIHAGNTINNFSYKDKNNDIYEYKKQSQGCILVGFGFNKLIDTEGREQAALVNSREALKFLYSKIANKGGLEKLIITNKEIERYED